MTATRIALGSDHRAKAHHRDSYEERLSGQPSKIMGCPRNIAVTKGHILGFASLANL